MQTKKYNIELRDIHLYSHHGVLEQERNIGAWFTIDITLGIENHQCAITDNLEDTINYAEVYDIIYKEMSQPSNLLEHVCNRILNRIFNTFATVSDAKITLCKDTPPMGGDRLKAAVTLEAIR